MLILKFKLWKSSIIQPNIVLEAYHLTDEQTFDVTIWSEQDENAMQRLINKNTSYKKNQ